MVKISGQIRRRLAGPSVACLAAAAVGMPHAAWAQTTAGNAPPVAGDSSQSAPAANPKLPGAVPPGDAGTTSSTTPVAGTQATDAAAPATGGTGGQSGDIVVTGSRLTNGMRTPTPVTVTTASQLLQAAPNNIADGLIRLPAFGGSVSSRSPVASGSTGTIGQNLLNLRGLGDNRNLVLLDGRRIVSTNQDFAVDINTLPQNLISRVDVVTGGASAAYGSDAVAGVVNFVLDTKFRGLKGQLQGGVSTYGDLPSGKLSLAYGGSFAGDRLHVIASTENFLSPGIGAVGVNPRGWVQRDYGLLPNAIGKSPTNLVLPDIRSSIGSDGGLITTTGPLRGTQFLVGGTPAAFNYGYDSGSGFQSGGDGSRANFGFTPSQTRSTNFVHADFDVSPDVSAFGEFGYSYSRTNFLDGPSVFTGSTYAFTIYNTNPFLPASVKNVMTANNITSVRVGRYLEEVPQFAIESINNVFREAAGFKGSNLFGKSSWRWEAAVTSGQSVQNYNQNDTINLRNLYAATDAVVNPSTGQVVCRSQYYSGNTFVPGGTGLDAGCKPINVLGVNSITPSGAAYFLGNSDKQLLIHQVTVEAKLSGDLGAFELGAGPISFATGVEYRRDTAKQTTDALSVTPLDFTGVRGGSSSLQGRLGVFRNGNPLPFSGAQSVKEGFLEIGLPILKNVTGAQSLSADIAGRYTSYSLAGDVQTWKAGLDYSPVNDVRLRGTVSRDIRAPNLLELFNTAIQNTNNVLYPSSTNGTTTQNIVTNSGNPNLKPEKALTQTYGVVLTPTFLHGFSLSVDYYHIKLNDAIATLTAQNVVDYCAAGQQQYCANLSVDTTGVVRILLSPQNLSVVQVEGLDFETNYSTRLMGNPFSIRLLANHQIQNYSQPPNSSRLQVKDSAVAPNWKAQLQLQYAAGAWSVFGNERFISAVKMDPNQMQGVYIDNNHVPAVFYTDVTLTRTVEVNRSEVQIFATVENLFNREPPIDVAPPTTYSTPTNAAYDRIGRYITAGVRFKL